MMWLDYFLQLFIAALAVGLAGAVVIALSWAIYRAGVAVTAAHRAWLWRRRNPRMVELGRRIGKIIR